MSSPFPGMDPYLEAHWRDVHAGFVLYSRDALQDALPRPLRARVEERVVLETAEGIAGSGLFPDVRVVEYPGPSRSGGTATATATPLILEAEFEQITEGFIEIIDTSSGNRVVTIIEFLSPSNKLPGADRDAYKAKQRNILRSETSLVEVNLNRTGGFVLAVPWDHIRPRFRTRYMACTRRSWERRLAEVYPMALQDRLPAIRIPLRKTDPDALLDLQALAEQCYRNGGYDGTINYTIDADPPLSGYDAEWAADWLRGKGLRPKPAPEKKPPKKEKRRR